MGQCYMHMLDALQIMDALEYQVSTIDFVPFLLLTLLTPTLEEPKPRLKILH